MTEELFYTTLKSSQNINILSNCKNADLQVDGKTSYKIPLSVWEADEFNEIMNTKNVNFQIKTRGNIPLIDWEQDGEIITVN